MAAQSRVAAVTGANKGIGLAIVRNLALQYASSPLKSGPLLIYLTARSPERGADAVKTLNSDPQLKKAKVLSDDGGEVQIKYHELDISQTKSIRDFSTWLGKEHPDGIDFVIHNAAIALQGFDANVVKETLHTNYYGALEVTRDLLPLIRQGGSKQVNTTFASDVLRCHEPRMQASDLSTFAIVFASDFRLQLDKYSPEIRNAFLQAAKTDVPSVTALMEKFQQAVTDGREKEAGFPSAGYAVSKAGEIAMTKVIALEEERNKRGVLVNACCPGYVKTDMTRGGGSKTPDEGAQTPVMLALQDIGGKTGGFWQSEKEIEW